MGCRKSNPIKRLEKLRGISQRRRLKAHARKAGAQGKQGGDPRGPGYMCARRALPQVTCAQGGRSGRGIRGWVRKSGVPEVEGAACPEAEWIDLGEI